MSQDPTTPFDLITTEDIAAAQASPAPEASVEIASDAFAVMTPEPEPEPVLETALAVESHSTPPVAPQSFSTGGWTIPFLCAGLAILACCVLIPQTEANRRLVYERERLAADLERVDRQITTNDEFLKKIAADPTLSERLAQRQMKMIREGTSVLELKGVHPRDEMSPFLLVTVPPSIAVPPYQPVGGILGRAFANPRSKLYLMGLGLMLTAAGLVLGASNQRT